MALLLKQLLFGVNSHVSVVEIHSQSMNSINIFTVCVVMYNVYIAQRGYGFHGESHLPCFLQLASEGGR